MSRNKTPPGTEPLCAPDAVDVKLVARIGLGVIVVLWGIVVLIYPLFHYFAYARAGGRKPAHVLAYRPELPPRPRDVTEPFRILEKQQKIEQGQLDSYYWVDRSKGIVAIPIDRAMQIIAKQGVPPTTAPKDSNEYYRPRAGSMRTGFEGKVVSEPQ